MWLAIAAMPDANGRSLVGTDHTLHTQCTVCTHNSSNDNTCSNGTQRCRAVHPHLTVVGMSYAASPKTLLAHAIASHIRFGSGQTTCRHDCQTLLSPIRATSVLQLTVHRHEGRRQKQHSKGYNTYNSYNMYITYKLYTYIIKCNIYITIITYI